jgi:hypothetical protein
MDSEEICERSTGERDGWWERAVWIDLGMPKVDRQALPLRGAKEQQQCVRLVCGARPWLWRRG